MRLLSCSEVKDKRKKDLMDPLLIMKDCVDRKKTAHSKKKDKSVNTFQNLYNYLHVFYHPAQ